MEEQRKKLKLYLDYKVGERWDSPTTKITVKIPTNIVEGFLRPYAAKRGATVSWWAGMLLMHGVATYIKEYERYSQAQEAAERRAKREERKANGYWKRSLRRYGMLGEDEELEEELPGDELKEPEDEELGDM